jgi:alkyl hydroperoxide reductase subunit AhpC
VGILCDSVYALKAWAESLGSVEYPLCSDFWPHGQVSQVYGVFNEEFGRPERAIIVVDAEGICRYIDVHTLREVPDEEEIADELKKLT